jgi:hypothetical protein
MVEFILDYLFCCQYTTTEKIIELLEDLATKKRRCLLTNKLKNYDENYHQLYLDVLKYFKVKDVLPSIKKTKVNTWTMIKKKVDKEILLKNFVVMMKHRHNFDDDMAKKLKRDFMIGLSLKNINEKNIVVENGIVTKILGLHCTSKKYTWDFDIFA